MRKRELLLGFGAGILVATAVIGLCLPKPASVSRPLTAEQMKEAAAAMDMVVISKDEYEQLQDEQRVSLAPAAKPPAAPQKPEVEPTAQPVIDQVSPPAVTQPEQPKDVSSANTPAVDPAAQTAPPKPAEAPAQLATATFTIPYKATAESVSKILVEEKILPADNHFVDELRSQNKLNRIRVGTYEISIPATEEEIVQLVTTPPKK